VKVIKIKNNEIFVENSEKIEIIPDKKYELSVVANGKN